MRVTAVIPNYNHARFLEARVAQVLGQTRRPDEVVLLDDASTDGSQDILRRYEGRPGVRVVLNAVNGGSTYPQWNRGVGLAGGEVVWIAESDDLAEPELLETLLRPMEADPAVGVSFANGWEVDEAGGKFATHAEVLEAKWPGRFAEDFVMDGREFGRRIMCRSVTLMNASAVAFRRDLYGAVGGAPESMRLAGDWVLWARIIARCRVAYSARPLNHHRQHGQTVRRRSREGGVFLPEMFEASREARRLFAPGPAERRAASGEFVRTFEHWLRTTERPPAGRVAATILDFARTFGPAAAAGAARRYLLHGNRPAKSLKRRLRPTPRSRGLATTG